MFFSHSTGELISTGRSCLEINIKQQYLGYFPLNFVTVSEVTNFSQEAGHFGSTFFGGDSLNRFKYLDDAEPITVLSGLSSHRYQSRSMICMYLSAFFLHLIEQFATDLLSVALTAGYVRL